MVDMAGLVVVVVVGCGGVVVGGWIDMTSLGLEMIRGAGTKCAMTGGCFE